jgi:hypothetical protein
MADKKILIRRKRKDGLIGNYLAKNAKPTLMNKPREKPDTIPTTKPLFEKVQEKQPGETLQKLISLGFEQVGRWFWDGDDLNFELTQHQSKKDILYAFVVDGEVKYIGKSVLTLHKRIYFYKNCGPSQRTNIRVRDKLRACLKNGSQVLIYAFVQKMPLMYQDIPINLAAGLEDNLIAAIRPEWNIR